MNKTTFQFVIKLICCFILLPFISCTSPKKRKAKALYESHCASCHLLPSIQDLPKDIWLKTVLPEMGTRLGIKNSNFNPYKNVSFNEMKAINQSGVYPIKQAISIDDWNLLVHYISSLAPESIETSKKSLKSENLEQFTSKPISIDTINGTYLTFLKYKKEDNQLLLGDISGNLSTYNYIKNETTFLGDFGTAITDFTDRDTISYTTAVGILNPSELSSGRIFTKKMGNIMPLDYIFHRPVNTLVEDLNNNGKDELIVSEYGHLTGKLSLISQNQNFKYTKTTLLNQPGTIRVVAKDMNDDGKKDLIVLAAQGDENISILYQQENLNFDLDKVIRYSPIYGISWFELIDFNGDGYDDIITVCGDNADKTYIQKPYHGLRIHINDGENNFEERYFYPLNGATRLVANDYDKDGDIDFGIISTFPNYKTKPEYSFVYLENIDTKNYQFLTKTVKEANLGRWLLMDSGDIDKDGDEDIILSSFTYSFAPVPNELTKFWNEKNVDILVLENNLIK